jgi:hypothetical protein
MPLRTFLPELPVRKFASPFPVALVEPLPLSVRFSTLAASV